MENLPRRQKMRIFEGLILTFYASFTSLKWLHQENTENVLKTTFWPNGRKRWNELCICLCFTQLSVNIFHPAIVNHVQAPHWVSVYAFEENRLGFRNSCQLQAGYKKMDVLLNWLLFAFGDLPLFFRGWVMSSLLLKK